MDEEKIYDLYMNQHLTSQQIAEKLGYNRNGVKNFISKRGWKRKFIKNCIICGKQFETDRERNKYCSEECHKKQVAKDNVKYHRPKSGMKICENCGKEYYFDVNVPSYYKDENQKTGVNAARFCSYECGRGFGWKKEKETNLEKYGHVCSVHGEETKEKAKQTFIEHYGVDSPFKSEEIQAKAKKTLREKCEKGYTFKKTDKSYSSKLENDIRNFIQSLGFDTKKYIIGKNKTRFEIDIYISDLNIGIEVNGCWWHSVSGLKKGRITQNYHFNKYMLAKEKGIDLIQIWEDQWVLKQDIVKDILKSRLGVVSRDRKIYARECQIREIDNKTYKEFCERNHIQGYRAAEVKLGLFYNEELVQIASFNKCKDYGKRIAKEEWEWIRGCPASNNSITGGTSKLFSFFIQHYNPSSVLCYADCNLFNGQGYEKCGFVFDNYTGPDKFYIENNTLKRHARNPYKYQEYKQLVEDDKLFECYGAGSLRFVWKKGLL